MDAAGAPIPPPDASSSPPPYPGQGTAAFPIAIVIAIGFMVTSLILISYYFLVVRCWLRGGGPGGGGLLHRSRRGDNPRHLVERVSAVFFTDHEAAELPGGLDPDVVAALPVVRYYNRRRGKEKEASSASECAVCLGEFAQGERLKKLPTCSHAFHIDCIDTWLHHNVSCPLCRTVVTLPLARGDDPGGDASCRDLGDSRRIDVDAAGRVGYGSSCRFPTKTGVAAQEPITRSFSMDCFAGGLGRKPQTKEHAAAGSSSGEAGPSLGAAGSSSNVADRGAGETSGQFRRLLSSFGLGRSSRSTVLPIHLDL